MKETIHWGPEDIAADSDALAHQLKYNETGYAFVVKAARINGEAAVAAADTNYNTYQIKNGSTVVASLANGPAASGTAIPIGSSAGAAFALGTGSLVVGPGEFLWLDITKTGSGLAVPGARIQIDIEYIKTAT